MRLFKADAYIVVTTPSGERIDLSAATDYGRRLDLDFFCDLNKSSEPNQGDVTVYNLKSATRNKILKDSKLEVFAGYDGNEKLIFIGDVKNVKNSDDGIDWASNILCGDGQGPYLEAKFVKSYREGVNIADVVKDLADSFGLAVRDLGESIKGQINGGLSVSGASKDILNQITKDYGLEWSIQDDEVRITQQEQPIDNEAIVISSETGLLNHPQVTEKGVDFEAQLNPDIRPGKLVRIESGSTIVNVANSEVDKVSTQDANGLFLVERVRFVGNNYGGDFKAIVTCNTYDGQ